MTRDAGETRDPGTGTQVGPKIFSDLKFEFLKNEKCFSKLDNFIAFSAGSHLRPGSSNSGMPSQDGNANDTN